MAGSGLRWPAGQVGIVLSVWLIVFLSEFVFRAAIAVVLRGSVEVSGLVGLLVMIVCLTVAQRLVEFIDEELGGRQPRAAPFDGTGSEG